MVQVYLLVGLEIARGLISCDNSIYTDGNMIVKEIVY